MIALSPNKNPLYSLNNKSLKNKDYRTFKPNNIKNTPSVTTFEGSYKKKKSSSGCLGAIFEIISAIIEAFLGL